jgi:peroxiredoxin (alkyl hydroperoxide reductase subunit C)
LKLKLLCPITVLKQFPFHPIVANISYRGKYVLLFFYPLDFTFVCPSEILAFNRQLDDFTAKNCELLGVSVDSIYTHLAWKNTPVNLGGIGTISTPTWRGKTPRLTWAALALFNSL